jgi:4-hydroxy-tetrahydrodipicolinate reductase
MNIALFGYGKMGKLIEKLAGEYDAEIVAIVDPLQGREFSAAELKDADVCIDFTEPGAALENIQNIAKAGKNIVIGTTGWYDEIEKVKKIVMNNNIGLLYGSNFSIGMNMFYSIVAHTAQFIDQLPEYDIYGMEQHHSEKKDSPSGTARVLSDILCESIERKKRPQYDRIDRKPDNEELHFASMRAGSIPGTHTVGFDSKADTIELTHRARSREGFARGALIGARWLQDKTGIFDFREEFKEIISS